jgi:hypothetical protein
MPLAIKVTKAVAAMLILHSRSNISESDDPVETLFAGGPLPIYRSQILKRGVNEVLLRTPLDAPIVAVGRFNAD